MINLTLPSFLDNERVRARIQSQFQKVDRELGDSGTCVLGFELTVRGVRLCSQPWQGSLSCDAFYKMVREYLMIEENVIQEDIITDYGRMD